MILVLGSINMDLVVVTNEIPKTGETVIGNSFNQYPGGKGSNQAVCAARLNAPVSFCGKVGKDVFGDTMLKQMEASGVDISSIERGELPTGIALISVDTNGQNSIIVVPGANSEVDLSYMKRHLEKILQCDIVLAQQETPIAVTQFAFELAKRKGKITLLNPAPAMELSDEIIAFTDILVPNEHELARITGRATDTDKGIKDAAVMLLDKGVKAILVTMGAKGVWFFEKSYEHTFPAKSVKAVDTTAAGDSFLGGFVASYSKERDIEKAIEYGQLVASYTVQRAGAQSSMPTKVELEAYINCSDGLD
jgi:ribokinase